MFRRASRWQAILRESSAEASAAVFSARRGPPKPDRIRGCPAGDGTTEPDAFGRFALRKKSMRTEAALEEKLDTFPRLLLHHARVRPIHAATREKHLGIWQ